MGCAILFCAGGKAKIARENDTLVLYDAGGDTLLCADEARAYLQTKRLLKGEVRVNTLLFAAPDIRLNRAAPGEDLNAGFLIGLFHVTAKRKSQR